MKNFIFICIAYLLSSCLGKPEFSKTPLITFKSITLLEPPPRNGLSYGDSMIIAVEFEDGDGDLGTSAADTSIKAFKIVALRKIQNSFTVVRFIDENFTLGGNFDRLSNVPDSPIRGEIQYRGKFEYVLGGTTPLLKKGDIVKFQIQITDRAKNKSNIVESNEVVLGKY